MPLICVLFMNKKRVIEIVLIALFTALSFVGTMCMIPLPTGDMIHLGNFICILAALLLGGVKGGICGSLGMGLYDICFYFDSPTTIIRTFILKFLMGLIAGVIFKVFKNKDKKYSSSVLLIIGLLNILLLSLSIYMHISVITMLDKVIKVHFLVPTAIGVFLLLDILIYLYIRKKDSLVSSVAIAASLASIFNVTLEFIVRLTLGVLIDRLGFMPSLVNSFSKLPASVLTSTLTIFVVTAVYPLIYRAVAPKYKEYLI